MPTILVFPAGFRGGKILDEESMIRLRKAFAVYQNLCKNFLSEEIYFVSSVQDRLREDGLSQSEEMKKVLSAWGVPPEQIIISNESSDTLDDIKNSYRLIREHGLPEPVINVSSWYHIPRIWIIWNMRKETRHTDLSYVFAGSSRHFFALEEFKKIKKFSKYFRYLLKR